MKKFLLICTATIAFFAADAQTKKSKKSSKSSSAAAKFNKQEETKKLARTALLDTMRMNDSMRLSNDSLYDTQMELARVAYKDSGYRAIDSLNKESYGMLMKQRQSSMQADRNLSEAAKSAKLSEYEATQVKYINQQYNDKAKALMAGGEASQTKQALVSLNDERRAKIRAILGKGDEKRFEKERKSYALKNGADADSQWIEMAEQYAKNK